MHTMGFILTEEVWEVHLRLGKEAERLEYAPVELVFDDGCEP